ncbi:hypothetical protein NQL31_000286 [Lotmaria passim]
MSSACAPAAAVPAPRLRARTVNTSHVTPAKTNAPKSSVTRRVVSPQSSSSVRPRTTAAAAPQIFTASVTRRTRSNVKPVAPGRVPAPTGDENGANANTVHTATPLTSIHTTTSQLNGREKAAHLTPTVLKKTSSSRSSRHTSASVQHHSGNASRLDSVCSSLPGSGGGDRGSAHRTRAGPPPPVPHLSHVSARTDLLVRAATTECVLCSGNQPATAEERKKSSPPESGVCTRLQSANEAMLPLSMPPPSPRHAAAAAAVHSGRTFASAPASRVSSVNSRLAEAKPTAAATRTAPRTRVVRTAGKRSASSSSDVATAAVSVPAAFAAAPPRATGVRPLLSASRRVVHKENTSTAIGASRLRGSRAIGAPQRSSSAAHAESGNRSARAATRQASLSGRRAAGALPSRKAARKLSDTGLQPSAGAAVLSAPPPPPPPTSLSKFQQTHTGCPPPLSFSSVNNHTRVATAAKGPVSPIKRTSTACPSGAHVYAAALIEEDDGSAARESCNLGGAAATDAAFACPWLKPGTFSTPTNRDGARESSEAPTVPYEGSTGQRASISLSPRTDFDSMPVSGRLSYGM